MAKRSEPVSDPMASGRYDARARRRAQRRGRERGCHIYIPAEELAKAGWPLDGPPPWFRVWGSSRGGLFIRLYDER